MSQIAVMVRVNAILFPKVLKSVPSYDDAIQICKDFGYESSDANYDGDYILVEYEWIEIGNEESDTDEFFDDETLQHIYDSYEWDEVIEAQGYNVKIVRSGRYDIGFDELEDIDV